MAQSNGEPPAPRQTCAFPSSLPPQLVISWLPVRDVGSALCASAAWQRASAAVFQIIAQSRGLGRERVDVTWSEVVRRSKKRVAVRSPRRHYPQFEDLARALGVFEAWTPKQFNDNSLKLGDVGDFISEVSSPRCAVAFRADRDGVIHLMVREGVLVGYPGELGTVSLTEEQVETLGVPDLKVELEARGVKATVPESGAEVYLKNLLWRVLHRLRYSISVSLDHPLEEWETIRQIL